MRPWIWLFARLILVTATAVLGACAVADDLQLKVQRKLDSLQALYGFPGATLAYVLPDGSRGTVASGLADVEAATPMTPQTRMLSASIGKSFVAATVLALESEGRLKRADLVSTYLATRPWFTRLPNHATILVWDLLRHTSGLPDHVHMKAFGDAMAERMRDGQDAMTPEGAIGFVLDQQPLFAAGAGWAYSDTGYLLLGLIIEEVTGRAYYDGLRDRFLMPLGLTQTTPSNQRLYRVWQWVTPPRAIHLGCRGAPWIRPDGLSGIRRWSGPAAGSYPPPVIWQHGAMPCSAARPCRHRIWIGCSTP